MSVQNPNILRRPTWDETFDRHVVIPRGRDQPGPLRTTDAKNLSGIIRKASIGDRLALPTGEHSLADLSRHVFLHGSPFGTTIQAPLRTSADFIAIIDAEFSGTRAADTIMLTKGILMLRNCRIRGGIRVENGATLYLRNCLVEDAEAGISLGKGARVELQETRITNCHSGLVLRDDCVAHVFQSRFDHCAMRDDSEWGAAIFAHHAELHAEGVRFEQNGVGLYLTDCTKAQIVLSHFTQHEAAAVIFAGLASSQLTVRSCTMERQNTARCAQVSATGGLISWHHVTMRETPAIAVSFNHSRVETSHSTFASQDVAIEAADCQLTATAIEARSGRQAALNAIRSQGTIRDSFFLGHPPVELAESDTLQIQETTQIQTEKSSQDIDAYLTRLERTVTEEAVRSQLERIFRQAHAAHQRKLGGLPRPRQNFHIALTGSIGLGKRAAAEWLADAWHDFGVTESRGLYDLTYQPINGHGNPYEAARGSTVFLSVREATGFTNEQGRVERALSGWMHDPNTVVILEGEREEIRRLVRQSPMLSEAFHNSLHFQAYGPVEFTTYFHQLCQADEITLSQEASEAVLLLLHIYCDRKDRRFATRGGIRAFYEQARERFFERSSQLNRFDGELEIRDLNLPPEKALKRALQGSPAYSSFCPSCRKENHWLPGLEKRQACLHCGDTFVAQWGIWRDSGVYKRMTQTTSPIIESGVISRRRSLLARP